MDLSIEPSTDMGYITLTDPDEQRVVAHTEPLAIDLRSGFRQLINLDFDGDGRLLGIEICGASRALPASLVEATRLRTRRPR